MITLVASIDQQNGIGYHGKTPWNAPEELALFKTITLGHIVLLGRKTFDEIGILPERTMIVLSETIPPHEEENSIFCNSISSVLERTKNERSLFVIGGAEVYAQMMPLADEMRISHMHSTHTCDTWFPEISSEIWQSINTTEYNNFTHIHYRRI